MDLWGLPDELEIGGRAYHINADFRDILDILRRLNDAENKYIAMYVALALFYDDFETMPEADHGEAVNRLMWFLSCGEEDDGQPHPKTIDWEQDRALIIADVNRVAGCEIRSLPFCHWWTFISWLNGVGEGQLSTVVSIREKLRRGKKLEKWEREYYRKNRAKVDFKNAKTAEDKAALARWGVN